MDLAPQLISSIVQLYHNNIWGAEKSMSKEQKPKTLKNKTATCAELLNFHQPKFASKNLKI